MFILFNLIIAIAIAAGILVIFQKKSLGIIAGLSWFVTAILLSSITIISAGHTGVQATFGEVNMIPLTEGIHLVNPLSKVTLVDVRLQKATLDNASAGTKDLQVVHTNIVINYRIDPSKTPHILKEFGLDVDDKVLAPSVNEAFKGVAGHYTSEELITKRDAVSNAILEQLKTKVGPYNITINSISLVNFAFSPEYQKAIEQKVIAVQQTAKAQQELIRIKVEAESRIAQAEGEAKAIQIQAAAIEKSGGKQYVELQAIAKWDGKLPTMMSGGTPFVNVSK